MIVDSEFSRKKLLVFGTLLLVVLAIPVTLYTAVNLNQKTNTQSKAANVPEDTVIVAINGQQYKKSDIRKVAEEQSDPSSVDQAALTNALNTLIERKILDKAATDLGITPEKARIDKYQQEGLTETQAKYEALREQVILNAVNSVEVISIGFWNPPSAGVNTLSAEQQDKAATELSEGIPALNEIESRMNDGGDPMKIADDIVADHPELAPVLAVNGYILSTLNEDSRVFAEYPTIAEYGDSSYDNQTRDGVFNVAENGVKKITNTSGNRGGMVVKIVNKGNLTGSSTYQAWLTEQKASSVREVAAL